MAEQVNHPKHYNAREDGLECIDIIRHYTCDVANALKYLWRAGLKQEADKTAREKEIEDLHKALWYIVDELSNNETDPRGNVAFDHDMSGYIYYATGHDVKEIIQPYNESISMAIVHILFVGLIYKNEIYMICGWKHRLVWAQEAIQKRIDELEAGL